MSNIPIRAPLCMAANLENTLDQLGLAKWVLNWNTYLFLDHWETKISGETYTHEKDKDGMSTGVPETMSSPLLAWCKACTIVMKADRASPSS